MAFWSWSKTASANATADSTINWAEGQAPSSVNDSSRAMMARTAEWRDDITGAIVTGGTSTAYTVASNQVFDTLAHMANQMIAFTPHATNGATVTLNVDGLGAKPLRTSPNVELQAGVLIQGTPYIVVYNNSDGAFYLRGFTGNPYNIPIGAGFTFWSSTTPNSSFVQPFGQAISRTTYSTLLGLIGVTYGAGDGSTTFNLPDMRGRVGVALDGMGGVGAGRVTTAGSGVDGGTLGSVGGAQNLTLATGQIPQMTGSLASGLTSSSNLVIATGALTQVTFNTVATALAPITASLSNTGVTGTVTVGTASPSVVRTVQPTIVCNYIMRII